MVRTRGLDCLYSVSSLAARHVTMFSKAVLLLLVLFPFIAIAWNDDEDDYAPTRMFAIYTNDAGCTAELSEKNALPVTAEERADMVRLEEERIREEDRVHRETVLRIACEHSGTMIEKARGLAIDAMRTGKKMNPYPLPIAEVALDTLRDSLPEDYHIHVETLAELRSVIVTHAVTPSYSWGWVENDPLHSGPFSFDYQALECRIGVENKEERNHVDMPIYMFTLYWDCTEEEFLSRRMDTWIRRTEHGAQCSHYKRCAGSKWIPSEFDLWTWTMIPGEWRDNNGPFPPHPRDL